MKTAELVAQELVAEIIFRRGLGVGSLEPEHELARNLRIGRASLRQALRLLESWGLIRVRCGSSEGPSIAPLTPASVAPMMLTFLSISQVTYEEVRSFLAQFEALNQLPGPTSNPVYVLMFDSLRQIAAQCASRPGIRHDSVVQI